MALSWESYLPKLYAGPRAAGFGEYRDQVMTSLPRAVEAAAIAALNPDARR